jgi:hypothetical protein
MISYPCLSPFPGGRVFACYRGAWLWKYEADDGWKREPMTAAKAASLFPSDASEILIL